MRLARLLILSLIASPLAAQEAAPRLEVGVDLSRWRTEQRTGNGIQLAGSVRAAVVLPSAAPSSLGFSAMYAPEAETAPGLLGFGSEFAQRLRKARPGEGNVFVSAGAGIMRFSNQRLRNEFEQCSQQPDCMYEGPPPGSGWAPVLTASLGADVPLGRGALLQPVLQLVRPVGEPRAGQPDGRIYRLGVGLAWRP